MRIGQNPAKSIDHVPQPARVTVALVTYIPFLSGYYSQSLEVLKTCLDSVLRNTQRAIPGSDMPSYDLLVFDNASCDEVRQYLAEAHNKGDIQYLVLSDRNIGKGGAWNMIFQGTPGDVIAYSDSDVYFSPGWLDSSLEILNTYPNVGMVTARPMRTPEKYYTSTLDWARQVPDVQIEKGHFQTWEMFKEHTDSVGTSEEESREWFQDSIDWRVRYNDVSAYVGAAHFQFCAPKKILQSVLPFQMDRPMGQVRSLDEKLNEAGYLRLCTVQPLVKHLGNRLEVSAQELDTSDQAPARRRIADLPPIRRSLMWAYDRIFRLYFEGNK